MSPCRPEPAGPPWIRFPGPRCTHAAQALTNDGVLDLVDGGGVLCLRVADAELVSEVLLHGQVHVLVDGGAEHSAGLVGVAGFQIRAAAGEADAEWCASDDHTRNSCSM